MKCRLCKTQMLVDRVVEKEEDGVAEVHYKCPNKNCANFGYSNKTENSRRKKKVNKQKRGILGNTSLWSTAQRTCFFCL